MGTKIRKEYFPVEGILVLMGLLILVALIGWNLFYPDSVQETNRLSPTFLGFSILGMAFLSAMFIVIAGCVIGIIRLHN